MNGNRLTVFMDSLETKKMIGVTDLAISLSIVVMEILKNN